MGRGMQGREEKGKKGIMKVGGRERGTEIIIGRKS